MLTKAGILNEDYRTNSLIIRISKPIPFDRSTIRKLDVPVPQIFDPGRNAGHF